MQFFADDEEMDAYLAKVQKELHTLNQRSSHEAI
jgi:hypothetical protein